MSEDICSKCGSPVCDGECDRPAATRGEHEKRANTTRNSSVDNAVMGAVDNHSSTRAVVATGSGEPHRDPHCEVHHWKLADGTCTCTPPASQPTVTLDKALEALSTMKRVAAEAHEAWDSDNDSRVGKLLMAMAGYRPGYRDDIDKALALLRAAEQK